MASSSDLPLHELTVQSPGRINIIGEHTDYNDGFVLPAAIDKKIVMKIRRNKSQQHLGIITAKDKRETFEFNLSDFAPTKGGWPNYIMGVVHELQKKGAIIGGFTATFEGNVPMGSGMSSSAALECSIAYALNELFSLGYAKKELILASQMAEHHFVGTNCGIMDQFASMMGRKDQVFRLDCRTLEHHYFPLELEQYQLLLINSNITHSLADSEYNNRRAACEEGVHILRNTHQDIKNLRDLNMGDLKVAKSLLPSTIYQRCHHVLSENVRVDHATKALLQKDFPTLGQLLYQSHFSLQHDYEVTCPETDFLVQETLSNDNILGSRQMGGGFGGCTINLIQKTAVSSFLDSIEKKYRERFGIDLTPYSVSIADGTGLR